MESFKKFLPYLLVAVIFAVGGYFIGQGNFDAQGAALYKAGSISQSGITAPTNGPAGIYHCGRPDGSCVRTCQTVSGTTGAVTGTFTEKGSKVFSGGAFSCQFLPTSSGGVKVPGETVKMDTQASATTKTQ